MARDRNKGILDGADLSRADFLKGAGGLVVAFSMFNGVVGALSGSALAASAPAAGGPALAPDAAHTPSLDAWLHIDAKGNITLLQSKVELGTGVDTALAQIAAEELRVPFSQVTLAQVETTVTPFDAGTFGSQSIQFGGAAVRQAAATAHAALLSLAAARLGADASTLTAANGIVRAPSGKTVTYGALIGKSSFDLKINPAAPLKSPSTYTIVGQAVPRVDVKYKLTGSNERFDEFGYVVNVRLPGMVHARILRPPAFGASLLSLDTASIKAMPGVIDVIPFPFTTEMVAGLAKFWTLPQGDFVAVVAENEGAAVAALAAMQASAKWSHSAELPTLTTTEEQAGYLLTQPILRSSVHDQSGNVDAAIAASTIKHEATYYFPNHTNAPIGAQCSVADVKPGSVSIYSGSEQPFNVQGMVAAALKVPLATVNVKFQAHSGSYGRSTADDSSVEAALLSQKLGRPVRVQWMRPDDFQWATSRTPMVFRARAGMSADGAINGWEVQGYSDTHVAGGDFGATYGGALAPTYASASHRFVTSYAKTPLRKGSMRGLGGYAFGYATESFFDELAYLSGEDPVAFRLKRLSDPRALAVIHKAVDMAGWTPHTAPRKTGRGQGFSYVYVSAHGAYLAHVADVTVDMKTGKVNVTHVAMAADAGLVVNPDGVKNQLEGALIQGTSWTLMEQLNFNNQAVTAVNWLTYPIIRFPDVPEVDIALLDHPEQPAGGVGELGIFAYTAAIANAVYDATGARLRAMPFTPERVLTAIAHANAGAM